MKKNALEKYYQQKSWTIIEIVCVVVCYDLKKAPVVKGKDGKLRSAVYVISVFDFDKVERICG